MRNSVTTILGFVTSCLVVQPSDPPSPTELSSLQEAALPIIAGSPGQPGQSLMAQVGGVDVTRVFKGGVS